MKNYNIKELQDKLERCRKVTLDEVSIDDVDELSSVKINTRLNQVDRIIDFISKTKNPYIFKVNGKLVRFNFLENGLTADECLTRLLENLYRLNIMRKGDITWKKKNFYHQYI